MFTLQALLARQNVDGGWSYRNGSSWTEPTCYALLALAVEGLGRSDAAQRGAGWLARRQRADGGWAPGDAVEQSTWVTALVLLLPVEITRLPAENLDRNRASAWLLAQTGRESGFVHRLRMRLLGERVFDSLAFDGWPWYPGAAAWVTPTALSILALEKLYRLKSDESTRQRAAQGRAFLLARRCRDGGWNHGSTKALGYDSDSYPETTGLALLALHSSTDAAMSGGVAAAERHLAACKSSQAASWLTLALLARGRQPAPVDLPPRGETTEIALDAVVRAARQGRNVFVE